MGRRVSRLRICYLSQLPFEPAQRPKAISEQGGAVVDVVESEVSRLPVRDQELVRAVFGLREPPRHQASIAKLLGISREAVRRRLRRVFNKLRKNPRLLSLL